MGSRGRGRGRGGKRLSSRSTQPLKGNGLISNPVGAVQVSNLDYGITHADLKEIFAKSGNVNKITLNFDENGKSRGTAVVTFKDRAAALKAVDEYDRAQVDGRTMFLKVLATVGHSPKKGSPKKRFTPQKGSKKKGSKKKGSKKKATPKKNVTPKKKSKKKSKKKPTPKKTPKKSTKKKTPKKSTKKKTPKKSTKKNTPKKKTPKKSTKKKKATPKVSK